jgi:hypothetical protein
MKTPGRTMLRFQVPPELLPLQVERAALLVDLNAQARSFEVFAGPQAGLEVLAAHLSPVGSLRIPIDRPQVLQPDARGGIFLGIAVGEARTLPGGPSSQWKIDSLQLEVAGRTR